MNVPRLAVLSKFRLDRLLLKCRAVSITTVGSTTNQLSSTPLVRQRRGGTGWLKEKTFGPERMCFLPTTSFHSASVYCSSEINALKPSQITEAEYEICAEETLDSLTEFFEDLPETETCNEDYDCAYGNGVLTVHIGSIEGTYVINKQTPNKQIWLSSPLSGPKRYDYCEGQWVYLRDGSTLHRLLEAELSEIMGLKIDLSKCKFYTKEVVDNK